MSERFLRNMRNKRWGRKVSYDEIIELTESKAVFAIKEVQRLYDYFGLTVTTYPEKTVVEKIRPPKPSKQRKG